MLRKLGQFDVPGNTRGEYEFPCPGCGEKVKGEFKIKPETHSDETAGCRKCGKSFDVTVLHDDGSGTVNIHDDRVRPKDVKAQGLP